MNSQQTGDAGTFGILAADQMTGTFGRDHEHIDVGSRLDLTKVNVEAVGKRESSAGFEVGSDMLAEGGITTSAWAVASATVATFRPAASALAQDLLPLYRPTVTSTPLSFKLSEWAWPWLP